MLERIVVDKYEKVSDRGLATCLERLDLALDRRVGKYEWPIVASRACIIAYDVVVKRQPTICASSTIYKFVTAEGLLNPIVDRSKNGHSLFYFNKELTLLYGAFLYCSSKVVSLREGLERETEASLGEHNLSYQIGNIFEENGTKDNNRDKEEIDISESIEAAEIRADLLGKQQKKISERAPFFEPDDILELEGFDLRKVQGSFDQIPGLFDLYSKTRVTSAPRLLPEVALFIYHVSQFAQKRSNKFVFDPTSYEPTFREVRVALGECKRLMEKNKVNNLYSLFTTVVNIAKSLEK